MGERSDDGRGGGKLDEEGNGKMCHCVFFFFFQAEDGIRDDLVTGVQTCALPILANGYSNELNYLTRQVKLVGLQQECATYLHIESYQVATLID